MQLIVWIKNEAPLGTGPRKLLLFKCEGSNKDDFVYQIRASSTDLLQKLSE